MVSKPYAWVDGAKLEDHTKRKHKILREYFRKYVVVRCQNPQQSKFRLVVVDGFSGAGRYACGSPGSPIIFIEEIRSALDFINLRRIEAGISPVEIECLFIFNDANAAATQILRDACAAYLAAIAEQCPRLHTNVHYLTDDFEVSYSRIKGLIAEGRYRNILYNLDQCGHSKVKLNTLLDIMRSAPSVEVFYTFAIESLLSFLSRTNPELLRSQVHHLGIDSSNLRDLDRVMSNNEWLGAAERIVFETFKGCASFVSPFSINNPNGWRYWLIHFANNYRARQVYNDILHTNSSNQAHYGRSGLEMLVYDPSHHDGSLYLFDDAGREKSKVQLLSDIPRLIGDSGDAMTVGEFYETIYNSTPAHKDDIHQAVIENQDLEVRTPGGGERRKANTIIVTDTIKMKNQRTLFPIFMGASRIKSKN